jgi:uncharacterized protein
MKRAWIACAIAMIACGKKPDRGRGGDVGGTPITASPSTPYDQYFRASYTKYEYRIPMRDGVRLFTAVYVPNDAAPNRRYPIVINRTPYSVAPYGADRYTTQISEPMGREGYIHVHQDVRGRYMSEGTFDDMRPILDKKGPKDADESTDCYDTIAWLLAHVEHHNGKVGMLGQSYDGFFATAGAIDGHPALVAVVPMAPVGDVWVGDDDHRNGTFALQASFAFFSRFGVARPEPTANEHAWPVFDYGTPDAYQFFLDIGPLSELDATDLKNDIKAWNDIRAHPDYDAFWKARNILPRLKNIRAAMWFVGGWYDTEDMYGTLESYRSVEKNNRNRNTIIMGPWVHGGWWGKGESLGDAQFGFPTAIDFEERMNLFFAHHLKGGPDPGHAEAEMFETGANRWRRFASWPPKDVRPTVYYLREGGLVAPEPPTTDGADEYVSDPARPVPYTANPTSGFPTTRYMAEDQRFAARRPDVLVYQTPPLADDLTIAGPIDVELYVSTTGTDADWIVKVIDVLPGKLPGQRQRDLEEHKPNRGAKQILVRGEPFRGRYRDSAENPTPFVPNQVTKISFRVDDVFHTFLRDHRLMIQIQSSWFPFYDRNPQTFVPNIFEAKRGDFVKATHRVHHAPAAASKITVQVLPAADAE